MAGAPGDAFRLGIDHGVYCIGCCWALMLVLFALGAGSLMWMAIAGRTMAAEKNAPWAHASPRHSGSFCSPAGSWSP